MGVFGFMAYWMNEVPDHLKTQESCIEAVEKCIWLLQYVPDHFKTQEMCAMRQCSITRTNSNIFLINQRCRRIVKGLLKKVLGAKNMSLVTSRQRKCVLKPWKKKQKD